MTTALDLLRQALRPEAFENVIALCHWDMCEHGDGVTVDAAAEKDLAGAAARASRDDQPGCVVMGESRKTEPAAMPSPETIAELRAISPTMAEVLPEALRQLEAENRAKQARLERNAAPRPRMQTHLALSAERDADDGDDSVGR